MVNETENNTIMRGAEQINSKVTLANITTYNNALANKRNSDKNSLWKLLRYECLYKMMQAGSISKDSSSWFYLGNFANEHAEKIETPVALIK